MTGGQSHVRLPVRVGAGAKVTIVERQVGAGDGLASSVSQLTVGDDAEVTWVIVQEQPDDGDASRPVQGGTRQEREAVAVLHEHRRQAGAPGNQCR